MLITFDITADAAQDIVGHSNKLHWLEIEKWSGDHTAIEYRLCLYFENTEQIDKVIGELYRVRAAMAQ